MGVICLEVGLGKEGAEDLVREMRVGAPWITALSLAQIVSCQLVATPAERPHQAGPHQIDGPRSALSPAAGRGEGLGNRQQQSEATSSPGTPLPPEQLHLRQGSQVSMRVARGSASLLWC